MSQINKQLRDEFYEFLKDDELKNEDICAWWLEKLSQVESDTRERTIDGFIAGCPICEGNMNYIKERAIYNKVVKDQGGSSVAPPEKSIPIFPGTEQYLCEKHKQSFNP